MSPDTSFIAKASAKASAKAERRSITPRCPGVYTVARRGRALMLQAAKISASSGHWEPEGPLRGRACTVLRQRVAAPVYPPKPKGVEENDMWGRWCPSYRSAISTPNWEPGQLQNSGCDGRIVVVVKSGYLVRPWQRGCTKQSN
jgi:hypothetical protein